MTVSLTAATGDRQAAIWPLRPVLCVLAPSHRVHTLAITPSRSSPSAL